MRKRVNEGAVGLRPCMPLHITSYRAPTARVEELNPTHSDACKQSFATSSYGSGVTHGGHCNNWDCKIRWNGSFHALSLSFVFTPGSLRSLAA